MAGKLSIDIAVLLKGVEQINKLADSLTRLKSVSGGSNATIKTPSLKQPIDEAERYNKSILNAARALATFQSASGNLTAAQRTLEAAINKVGRESQITLGAQTQLARVQTQLRNEAERTERTLSANALLRARNRQSLGDEAGAVNILNRAISQLTPGTAAAARAQKLLNDISTGYANSPLIGAIQQVNRSLGFLSPVLGRTGSTLQSIVGVAGKAAEQFGNTAKATDVASKGASQFATFLNSAKQVAKGFTSDQSGSASLTDFLLNLSKQAANAGDRIRAAFASIRDAIRNAFSQIRQGQNPLAGLFSGGTGTAGADTAKLASSLGEVETAAQGTGEAVAGIGAAASGTAIAVAGVVVALVAVAATATAILAVADAIKRIGEEGIQANRQLESLQIGIASVIAGVGNISKDGIELKGADKFNAALTLARDQVSKLKQEASELGLPVQEAAEGFQASAGPLTQFGLGLDDARKTTLQILLAMQALNIPLREAGQETRAILQGQTDRTARLNQILRITKEELATAKQRGDVQQLLNERLAGFAAGGAAFAQSFDGAIARAQARVTSFEQQVTKGLFDTIRDKANEALAGIAKEGGIGAAFAGLGDTLTNIFNRVGESVGPIFDGILGAIKTVSDFLGQNQKTVDSIIESVAIIIEQIAGIVVDLFKVVGASGDWNENANIVATILKVVAVVLATIREQVFLFNSALVAIGAGILRFFLEPLRLGAAALATILSLVPGLGSIARGVSDTINSAAKSLSAAATKNGKAVVDTLSHMGEAGANAIKRIDEASAKFTARRKADAAKNKVDTSGISFAGRPQAEDEKDKKNRAADAKAVIASEEKLQEARLALAKAFSDREIELSRSESELQVRILEQQLEDRKISLESFYAEKAKLIAADAERERRAIQDQILAERKRITEIADREQKQLPLAKNPEQRKKVSNEAEAERIKILAQIVELETKLNAEENKGDAQAEINSRKRIAALRDLQGEIEGVTSQLLEVTGNGFEAAANEIDRRFRELVARAILEFGESSPQVAAIAALKSALKTDATIRQIEREGSTRQAEFDFARVEIQNQLEQGLIGEIAARERILAIQKAFAEVERERLGRQIEAQKGLTGAASPEVLKLEVQRKSLDQLGIDPVFAKIRQGLESDLSGAFSDFIANARFNLEGLKNFATGVLDSFRKAIAKALTDRIDKAIVKPITDKFLDKILGIKTVDPAQLAQTVSTNSNTAATIANTAALIANTTSKTLDNATSTLFPDNAQTSALDVVGLGDQAGSDVTGPGSGLASFFDKVTGSFEKFASKLKGIVTGAGGGLKSALAGIVNAIGSVVTGILGALGGGGGGGKFSDLPKFTFAEGGYTGDGGKFQPAGIVHAGEYVTPADRVSQFGAPFFEAIRQGRLTPQNLLANASSYLSGLSSISVRARSGAFASGGLAAIEPSQPAQQGSGAQSLRIINVNDPAQAAEFLNSAQGEQVILNRITKSPAKWRAALKI